MDKKNKLLIVDGHSILNRAFYGVPLLTNSEGQPTNAVYGFMNILLKVVEEENPTHLGVAFDLKAPTFRHKMYKEYKGTRKGMPEELHQQVPVMKTLLSKLKIQIFEQEGYEADDILGTLSTNYAKKGFDVVVLSGDRDLLQLASDNIKIKIPKTKGNRTEVEEYYAKDVLEKYGVTPTEFIDVKALMGDSSDNIPGVPSIGEKTAVKIIKEYHNIDEAIKNAEHIKPKKASENLREFEEQARMSKDLATICIDCPVNEEIESYQFENLSTDEAIDYMRWLEFKVLIERLVANNPDRNEEVSLDIQYEVIEELTQFEKFIKNAEDTDLLAFKILDKEGFITISCKDTTYIIDTVSLDIKEIINYLKPIFESKSIKKIGYHSKEDIHWLRREGIQLEGLAFDVMIGAYLLNPSKDVYDIATLAHDHLHANLPTEEMLLGKGRKKQTLREIDKEVSNKFVACHSHIPYLIMEKMDKELEETHMQELFYNIEMPLIHVLADMEWYGIKVDVKALKAYGDHLEDAIKTIEEDIYEMAGDKFNINSPKQLGVILFEKMQLPVIKKTKTGYSTAADVLEKLLPEHDIIQLILEYRQLIKLKSTYVDGLFSVINKNTNKINSTFNQTVTATGRISSTEPNLQNIPIKLELGRKLRKVFIPSDDNFIFLDADYSQIELRLLAHLSGDEMLIKAYQEGQDIHRLTASQVFNTPFDKVTSYQRSNAKAVNFGIIYGISAFSLSGDLKITRKEAQKYIDAYFAKYPKIKNYLDECVTGAKETGYATTMFNRRRKIDELRSRNFVQRGFGERIAKNMPIQGSAADIIKIAMVNVWKRLKEQNLKSRLILQVHDELLIEVHKDESDVVKEILVNEMVHAVEIAVPLEIDMHEGHNWYETK